MKRFRTRLTTILAAIGMFALFAASPASAATAAAFDVDSNFSGNYRVDATCGAVIGVSTEFNEFTYTVEAEATASSTNAAVGVGTGVVCKVRDANTGTVFGTVAGGLPGPQAVAVDTVNVPSSATVEVVVCGSAVYSDGGSVSC